MTKRAFHRRALIALAVGSTLALAMAGGSALAQDKAEGKAPVISAEAQNAVSAMSKTLSRDGFSFQDRTIREYNGANGQPLHIFHTANVVVRRPDRFAVAVTGDDGTTKIAYNGKNLILYSQTTNRYASLAVSGTIEEVLREASIRLGMDFPLADLLADAPDKAFLYEVTSGYVVDTVPVDDVSCLHLFFMQPPGIELELWTEKNDRALPRRLIATYRSLPGEPRFIVEISNWKTGLHPSDSDFEFSVPQGATKMELGQEAPK